MQDFMHDYMLHMHKYILKWPTTIVIRKLNRGAGWRLPPPPPDDYILFA